MDIKEHLEDQFRFKSVNNHLYGVVNSYGIVITFYDNTLNIKLTFNNLDTIEEVKEMLFSYQEEKTISSFSCKDFGLELEIENSLIIENKVIEDLIENLTDKLLKLRISNTCERCNEDNMPAFIKLNETLISSCESCTSKSEKEINDIVNRPNNYLLGFLGAILGSIIGSALWIAVGALGYVTSIGGIVIALAAIKGYDLFRGKNSKIKALIIIVSIIIGVFFAEYIGVMIASFKLDPAWTIKLWIQETPYLFIEDNLFNDMLPSIITGLIFAALGTIKMIKSLFTERVVVNKLERI